MLPLRMVHAATTGRGARILDDRDDREPLFHTRQLAADIEPAARAHQGSPVDAGLRPRTPRELSRRA